MTAPTVAQTASTLITTGATTHAVNLPTGGAGRVAVVVGVGRNMATPGVGWPDGTWNERADVQVLTPTGEGLAVAYKDYASAPPSTINITTTNTTRCIAYAFRCTGYDAASVIEVATTLSTSDPPSLAPSWGSDDCVVITACVQDADYDAANAAWPYASNQLRANTGISWLGVCSTTATASSFDPSTWSAAEQSFAVATIAVRGVSAASFTGTVAVTQAAQTSAATGQMGYSATSATTQAPQTAAASGQLGYSATSTTTQANQAPAASGTFTPGAITGSVAVTQASQTASAAGQLGYTGTAGPTQAAQTAAGSGQLGYSGTAAPIQAAQVAAAAGQLGYTGSAALTQQTQTSAASGTAAGPGAFAGTAAVTQANQTGAATGTLGYTGAVSTAQTAQTAAAVGQLGVSGTVTALQAAQTAAATGWLPVSASVAVTQADQTAAATGVVSVFSYAHLDGTPGPWPGGSLDDTARSTAAGQIVTR